MKAFVSWRCVYAVVFCNASADTSLTL